MSVEYKLEELVGGHSGAENYKISAHGQNFMLKIFPEGFKDVRIRSIPHVCKLYRQLGINSLECLKIGKLASTGQYFCIYNYIDGRNMERIGESEYTPVENYQLGCFTGKWAQLLKTAKFPNDDDMREFDIDDLTQHACDVYKELSSFQLWRNVLADFEGLDIDRMLEMFQERAQSFSGLPKCLIHGDIKRSNLMRDQQGVIYLIDIESMKYGYDMLNFRYQLTWLFRKDSIKRSNFLRGFFDGLYDGTRPEGFNNQFIYVYVLNFFEHALSLCKEDKTSELRDYCQLINENWSRVVSAQGYII